MAIIFVTNLVIRGTHGAHLPTAAPKDFKLDIEITVDDIQTAATTDNIGDVYDYRCAVRIARKVIEGPSVHLIETLASRIVNDIATDKRVQKIKLALSKRESHDEFDSGITLEQVCHHASLN